MTDNLDKATPLIEKILPVADGSMAWYFAFFLIFVLVVFVINKYFELKMQKDKKPTGMSCDQHSQTLTELQTQVVNLSEDTKEDLQTIREEINMHKVESERIYHHMFREMMAELQAQMDRRDDKMERMIDSKLSNFKEGLMLSIKTSFRPVVQEILRDVHNEEKISKRNKTEQKEKDNG
jgi:DNA anti-recombination protein RmuC